MQQIKRVLAGVGVSAGLVVVSMAAPASAQTVVPTPQSPATSPLAGSPPASGVQSGGGEQGVLVYPPSFFVSSGANTALDMIRRLPGFTLEIGNVGARGLAGATGNVLIDGDRPSSKSDTLDQVLIRIAAASVERIELIRGGAAGIDMQGRAVVANVVLRKLATRELAVEANTYVYPDGYVGPSAKLSYSHREGDKQTEGAIFATTDRTEQTADGDRVRYTPGGIVTQRADLDLWDRLRDVNARGAVQRRVGGGKLRVNGLAQFQSREASQFVDVLAGAGSDESNESLSRLWLGELGATWTRPLGARSDLELVALQKLVSTTFDSASANAGGATTFASDSLGGESIVRAIWKFRPNSRWSFESGGEVAYNFLDSTTGFTANGTSVPLPNASVLVSEIRGEGFGQGTWRPRANVTVEAGLRFEVSRISQSGDTDLARSFFYPKPRAQLTWVPAPGHQFRLRAERKVGQLDFGQFVASTEVNLGTVAGGNAELVPSRELVLEAVYERRFWGRGVFDVTFQHSEVDDLIDIIPLVGGLEAIGNVGHGSSDFLQTRLTLPLDRLGLKDGRLVTRASWGWSRVTDPLTGQTRRYAGQVPFACSVGYSQDLRGGRFVYGFEHGCNVDRYTNYRIREVRTTDIQPYISIYAQWKPAKDLTVRLDLGNITDIRVRTDRLIYNGPRNAVAPALREVRSTRQGEYAFLQIRKVL